MSQHLDTLFREFLDDRRTFCAPATVEYYENMLHRFQLFLNDKNIYDINTDVIKSYLAFLRLSGVKNTSIHTYIRGIKSFCSWAILEGKIPPFNYKIKLPRQDPALDLPLSVDEVENILKYISGCDPDKLLLFRLMLDCGLRSSEALSLSRNDINFEKSFISIRYSKYNKSRIVPCPDRVLSLVPDQDGDLFDFSKSGKCSFFARLRKNTGIIRLHAHLLRHTFATSYMIKIGNLEFLRMYLGHSSYNVTQNYIKMAYQCKLLNYPCYEIDDIFK